MAFHNLVLVHLSNSVLFSISIFMATGLEQWVFLYNFHACLMWCVIQAASFIFPHIYGLDLHGGLRFVNFRLKLHLFWWSLQFPTKGGEHCPLDASSLFLRSLITCPALYYYNLYIRLTFHVDLWISKTEVMGDISLLSLDGFLEENSEAETVCILLTAAPWTRTVRYDMKALRVKKKKNKLGENLSSFSDRAL